MHIKNPKIFSKKKKQNKQKKQKKNYSLNPACSFSISKSQCSIFNYYCYYYYCYYYYCYYYYCYYYYCYYYYFYYCFFVIFDQNTLFVCNTTHTCLHHYRYEDNPEKDTKEEDKASQGESSEEVNGETKKIL